MAHRIGIKQQGDKCPMYLDCTTMMNQETIYKLIETKCGQ